MKKATGKKLTLEKLNITKLKHMSSIKGGGKTDGTRCDNNVLYYLHTHVPGGCPTKTQTSGNTILGG